MVKTAPVKVGRRRQAGGSKNRPHQLLRFDFAQESFTPMVKQVVALGRLWRNIRKPRPNDFLVHGEKPEQILTRFRPKTV